MIRALVVVVLLVLAAVWIAPNWLPQERTLALRVREPAEIRAAIRSGARSLGEELMRLATEREREADAPPAVAAGPPEERISSEERERLDRLVEEKLAEP